MRYGERKINKMERNVMTNTAKFAIKKDDFRSALNEVSSFLPPAKVLEGVSIISLEINSKEKSLLFTGMGFDNSLISKKIPCEGIEGDIQIYFDGPATCAKIDKLDSELTFEFSSDLRKLVIKGVKNAITINAFSELDFDENGNVIEETESTYRVQEAPVRTVLGAGKEVIGECGSFEVDLKPFVVDLVAVSKTPYDIEGVVSDVIKILANPKDSTVCISGTDGTQVGYASIPAKINNPLNEEKLSFILKKPMVEKLTKALNAMLTMLSKKKKASENSKEPTIKVSFSKTFISMEAEGTKMTMLKQDVQVPDLFQLINMPYSWYGIVSVSELKDAIDITRGASSSSIDNSDTLNQSFKIDLDNKMLHLMLSSSGGEGGASVVEYTRIEGVEMKDGITKTNVCILYSKLAEAISVIKDSKVLIRIHELDPNKGDVLITFVNAMSHQVYGFVHAVTATLK